MSVLEASEFTIQKIDGLEEKEKKLIINHVWTNHIVGSTNIKSSENDNSIIKEIEALEENQKMRVVRHVYFKWIKPILNQVDLGDAYCEEDDIYDVYGNDLDRERYSTSVLTKLISNLQKIVLEFEMSEDEDVIQERRLQAGVTLQNITRLINDHPIAKYDSERKRAYLLSRDGRKNYLNDD